jgi:hypothetical protein
MIEKMESRVLLSATFPSLVGSYTGTYSYTSGDSGTITLSVYNQVHGTFLGISTQSNGINAVVIGHVTPKGVVHFAVKPNAFREHGRGAGTFAAGVFNATEVIKGPGIKAAGTFTLTKN